MRDLTLNKFLGAMLAAALTIFGLHELSSLIFSSGGDHGGYHSEEQTLNERLAERYAYYVEVDAAGGGGGEEEEVFDLGLMLANADPSRGERAFKGKCATCHTIEQGGANGTGPNLYNVMGAAKAAHDGFSYSSALDGMEGDWTYANMNDWLYNPSSYVRGTSMAFAGLRRDDERVNVIAYLAQYSPDAPEFPEPLDTGSGDGEGDAMAEGDAAEGADPAGSGQADAGDTETDAAGADQTEAAETDAAPVEAGDSAAGGSPSQQ